MHKIRQKCSLLFFNLLCDTERFLIISADLTLLLIKITNHIHNVLNKSVKMCQQGQIVILSSNNILSDVLNLRLVKEIKLMIHNEEFECLIHLKL